MPEINERLGTGVILLAQFIEKLLDHNRQLIKPGRTNFEPEDFNKNYIAPDEIASSPLSKPKKFDGDGEVMSYVVEMQGQFTIDFYGDESYKNAIRFIALQNSQKGYELQRDSGLTVFGVSTITDLKHLTGSQYSPRYQLALNLRYNESVDVPTLRIDEAQVDPPAFNP